MDVTVNRSSSTLSRPLLILIIAGVCLELPALAQSPYYIYTGQSSAQTQIDTSHTSSWYLHVVSGPLSLGGGNFTMKEGSSATADVTLTLYQGSSTSGAVLATVTKTASSFTGQFNPVDFSFSSVQSLATGNYYVTLTSTAPNTQSQAFFIKGANGAIISLDGTTAISSSIATVTATPTSANLSLSKSATSTVQAGATITYTLSFGNDGGSASGTSATVADQLPSGVMATAATAGSGVSSVSCTNLNSTGALLTCTVTLTSALASAAPPGTAAFTITATAPSSAGSITNYASVDPTGGSSPATPGSSCSTTSCASATTTVNTPSNITMSKSGAATVLTNGGLTYTIGLGNSGGTASGTSTTVKDQLPAGVTATAAAAGTGVSSVSCTNLNSAGALLSCTVTLSSGLAAGASNGTAAFTITTTAPSSAGSITNYASVDPSGGSSPATPGASCSTTSCASATTTVNAAATPNLTMSKSAAATALTNSTITYTIGLGNSGGATSGTSATVKDQLPAGVTATAATAGTGLSSVSCTNLNSAGALLSCTVTLSSGLAPGASNGTASFTITTTAPSSAGSITNYASVDQTGGSSPATPGSSCSTTSCASATTTVNAAATPNLTMSKSAAATALTNSTITYTIGLGNSGGATSGTSATVKDQLPAGVTATAATAGTGLSSVSCTSLNSGGALLSCTVTLSSGLAAGASNGTAAFTITTTAPSSAGSITNYASVDPTGGSSPATPGASCSTTSCASATTTVNTPSNITMSKSGAATVLTNGGLTYTIGLGNNGGTASGTSATVKDQLPAGVTATAATAGTGVSSVNCTNLNSAGALLSCTVTLPSGLAAGASNGTVAFTITTTAPSSAGSISNYASVDPNGGSSPATPGASCSTTSCASASTTVSAAATVTAAPKFTLTKTVSSAGLARGASGVFTLTAANTGGPTNGTAVTVDDNMPAGLTPTSVDGSGWNCAISGQLVHCTRSDVLNAASSYPTIALTAKVAEDAPATLTNTASVSGGGEVSAGVGSVTVRILRADLRITKTHQGSFKRGQTGALYSIAVTNAGDAATVGLVTVTDTLPAGLIAKSIFGGGWSCTLSNLVCTRSEALAPGGAYPAIVLIVDVGATAAASVTNTASVAGGADADPSNNTAADVTAIAPSDLTVLISGPSSLLQGQHGAAYTIDVSNIGNAPTSEPSTATVVLPGGLILDSATGAGWDCSLNGQTATCTRTDLLAAGDAFPRITLGISVPTTATESGAITATVSGGGDGNLANNMSSVKFSITASPDLTITLAHTGTFAQGNVANYQITVRNIGAAKTNAVVTVTSQLPADLKPSSSSGKGWTCSIDGQTATCIRADELSANSSYPAITLDANIFSTAPAVIVTTAQVSGGGDVRTDNNSASDTASITQLNPDLKITMMHTGDFVRGQQQATFSMLVSNVGNGATRGAVTLANEVPAGLTPTGASGAGWDC